MNISAKLVLGGKDEPLEVPMRFFGVLLSLAAAFALSCSSGSNQQASGNISSAAPAAASGYIVGLQPGTTAAQLGNMTAGLSNAPTHVYDRVFPGFAATLSAREVTRLAADPRVRFVEHDLTLSIFQGNGKGGRPPKDPPDDGGGEGGDGGSGQLLGWGADRIDAELNNGAGGAGIGVAVFDTGIDLTHPDLAGAIVATYNATGGGSVKDVNGHGTHVAGIIGARDNAIGYVGVAPACDLIAVKVLGNSGSGSISDIVAGINWAIANQSSYNIRVGNMSFGASGTSSALEAAINSATAAGIVCVASAGNSAANAGNYIPARYANTLCVSALNPDDSFAWYSNWGNVVDLIAPGTDVPSLWKGGGYNTISGTSMAAPHVAGAVALWADDHAGGLAAAKTALLSSAEPGPWAGDPDGVDEPLVSVQGL